MIKKALSVLTFLFFLQFVSAQQIGSGLTTHITSFSDILLTGAYQGDNPTGGNPDISTPWQHLFVLRHINTSNNHQFQLSTSYAENDRVFFRKIARAGVGNPSWIEFATRGTNNFLGNQSVAGNLYVNGDLTVSKSSDGGGVLTLDNPTKLNSTQARYWKVFNMTGEYGNSLQFWAYDNAGCAQSGMCSNRFTITDDGKVGIGIMQPQVKFDVKGEPNNTIAPAQAVAKFIGGDYGLFTGTLAGPTIWGTWIQSMRTHDAVLFPLLLNPNGGNVGIGTRNPELPLHVNGGIKSDNLVLNNGLSNTNFITGQYSPMIYSSRSGGNIPNSGSSSLIIQAGKGDANNRHIFLRTNDETRLLIHDNGNVGIGTTNPTTKLDITGTTGGLFVTGENLDPQGQYDLTKLKNSAKLLFGWNYSGAGGEQDLFANRANGSVGGFRFYDYANDGTITHLMCINGNGNVGIGTTNPDSRFEVVKIATENGNDVIAQFKRTSVLSGGSGIVRFKGSDSSADIEVNSGYANAGQRFGSFYDLNIVNNYMSDQHGGINMIANDDIRIRISPSGKVGIGNDNPQTKLDVIGDPSNTIAPTHAVAKFMGGDYGLFLGTLAGPTIWGTWIQSMRSHDACLHPLLLNPNGGKVGIGTIDPSERLEVKGGNVLINGGDAVYETKNNNGYRYQLIGSYQGWDQESVYIAGYNQKNNTSANSYATKYIRFGAQASESMRINLMTGRVSIGTNQEDTTPGTLLTVKGTIHAKEVRIDLQAPLADFVFEPDYKLMPLHEVEAFVKINKHLPEIPSATEVKENGLSIGDMQNKLLQKVEELTLYVIEQNKEIERLKTIIGDISK